MAVVNKALYDAPTANRSGASQYLLKLNQFVKKKQAPTSKHPPKNNLFMLNNINFSLFFTSELNVFCGINEGKDTV